MLLRRFRRDAFTLIEMLIVVAIIAILVAVSIPMMQGAFEDSRSRTDEANEKIAWDLATVNYMTRGTITGGSAFSTVSAVSGAPDALFDASAGKWVDGAADVQPYGKCSKHQGGIIGGKIDLAKGLVVEWYYPDGTTGDTKTHKEALGEGFKDVDGAMSTGGSGGSGTGGGSGGTESSGGSEGGSETGDSGDGGSSSGDSTDTSVSGIVTLSMLGDTGSLTVSVVWTGGPSNVVEYAIERKEGDSGEWVLLGTAITSDNSYSDSNSLKSNVSYTYRVTATVTASSGSMSEVVIGTETIFMELFTELVPTGLKAESKYGDSVSLSWDKIPGARYRIERVGTDGEWHIVEDNWGLESCSDYGDISMGYTYTYRIYGLKDGKISKPSEEYSITLSINVYNFEIGEAIGNNCIDKMTSFATEIPAEANESYTPKPGAITITTGSSFPGGSDVPVVWLDNDGGGRYTMRSKGPIKIMGSFGLFSSNSVIQHVTLGANISGTTDMSLMFGSCSSLISVDMSRFDTSEVTNMREMFMSCPKLETIDMSGCSTASVTNMSNMFAACVSLTNLTIGEEFKIGSGVDTAWVTYACKPEIQQLIASRIGS